VWRCLELFDELNLPAAHLINTTVFEYAPQIVDALKARGDEFIGHGRTNAERHGHMWEADEKRFLEEVRDAIEKASGKRPRGWMAPWMASTRWTPDLLKEVGFDFLMDWPNDDQPLWMKTRSGPLMSVPYPIEINDSPQILVRHHSADEFRDFIVGQFEELLRQSAKQPLVCGIALHTMIVGQPYRLRALREALQHIANHPQKDKVWFTRPGEIYDHCAALPKGTMVPPPA
jgi:allantoinase